MDAEAGDGRLLHLEMIAALAEDALAQAEVGCQLPLQISDRASHGLMDEFMELFRRHLSEPHLRAGPGGLAHRRAEGGVLAKLNFPGLERHSLLVDDQAEVLNAMVLGEGPRSQFLYAEPGMIVVGLVAKL